MKNKKLHIGSFLVGIILGVIFLWIAPGGAYALTCEEVTPRFMDFTDQESRCIEPYEECIADPYDYSLGSCGGTCNEQYPGRINYIEGEGCFGVERDWIMDAYSSEFSESSAKKLADYCECINDCVALTREPYDIEERCTPRLESCCERVAERLNPDYDYSQNNDTDEDEEESGYFTISKIEGNGGVEIIREGRDEEVDIYTGGSVNEGDTLLVGYNTTVMLTRDDGYYLRIEPMSVIFVTKAYFQESLAEVQINLRVGSMTSKVQPARGLRAKFEIKTPTSVIGVRGTIFTVEYNDESGITNAYAHYHDIYFDDNLSEYSLDVSEGSTISFDGVSEPVISDIPDNKQLSEQLFIEYGTPTSNAYEYMSLDDTDGHGWLLWLSGVSCLLFLVAIIVLILFIRKKKKAMIVTSVLTLVVTGIICLVGVVMYFVLNSYIDESNISYDENLTNSSTTTLNSVNTTTTTTSTTLANNLDDSELETETIIMFENEDDKYIFSAGDITEQLTEVGPEFGYYSYCYPDNSGLGSEYSSCGESSVEIFSIREVGEVAYEEEYVQAEPLVNYEILGTSEDGYYYILELPNGEMPTELQPITQYTEEIVESFEVR